MAKHRRITLSEILKSVGFSPVRAGPRPKRRRLSFEPLEHRRLLAVDISLATKGFQLLDVDGDGVMGPGDKIRYTVDMFNLGTSDATTLKFTDALADPNVSLIVGSVTVTETPLDANSNPIPVTVVLGNAAGDTTVVTELARLPVGQGAAFTYDVQIHGTIAIPPSDPNISNQGTISYHDTDPAVTNNPQTIVTSDANRPGSGDPTRIPLADLAITQAAPAAVIAPGSPITYTITVTNPGPNEAASARVIDDFPATAGITGWTASFSGGAVGVESGSGSISQSVDLPAGSSVVYTATGTTQSGFFGSINNTAKVTSDESVDPNPANNSAANQVTSATPVNLTIAKNDAQTVAIPGTSVAYTVTVTNTGTAAVSGVTLSDLSTAQATIAAWSLTGSTGGATGTASGSGDVNASINLPAGSSVTYHVNANIASSATGNLTDTATLTLPAGFANLASNVATDVDTLQPHAVVTVAKTANAATAIPGQSAAYTITVGNTGPSDVVGATVADALPSGITTATWSISAATGGATGTTADGASQTVNLPAGSSLSYTVTTPIAAAATGSLVDSATLAVPGPVTLDAGSVTATGDVSVTLQPHAVVSVAKTANAATAIAGQSAAYTITVGNTGPSDVAGATVTDVLPSGIATATWSVSAATGGATGTTADGASQTVNLPAGSSLTYTVTTPIPLSATGSLTDSATLAVPNGVTLDAGSVTATGNVTVTIHEHAVVTVAKTANSATAIPGQTAAYTIVVSNTGPSDVVGATVTDVLPSGITTATWSVSTAAGGATGTTADGASQTVNLPAGSSLTYTVTTPIPSSATGSLADSATLAVPNTVTLDAGSVTATGNVSVTLQPHAVVTVAKTANAATAIPGQAAVYTIVVSNTGPSNVVGATVTDVLPSGITTATWSIGAATGGATGTTAAGASQTVSLPASSSLTYTVTTPIPAAATGSLTDSATLAVPEGVTLDAGSTTTSGSVTVNLSPQVGVSLHKSVNLATAAPGQGLVYTVVVGNTGPSTAAGVTVADTIPSGLENVSFTASATGSASGFSNGTGNTLNQTVTLPPGSSITYTVSGTIAAGALNSTLTNTATATVPAGETNTSTDTTGTASTSVTETTTLAVTETASSRIVAGHEIVYTITVQNTGTVAAHNVQLSDTLPAGTTFVSLSNNGGFTSTTPAVGSGGTVTATGTSLAPGATVRFVLVVDTSSTAATGSVITDTVSVTSPTASPGTVSASASTTVNVAGAELVTDPFDATKMDLVVSGTPGRDLISILPVGDGLLVLRNGRNLGTFNPTGRVVVYAGGGNDLVRVSPRVQLSSWLFGDAGRDSLYGGSGNNVIVGGDGRNFLYSAGRGRNLLIGGQGGSVILAPLAASIQIGGTTDFDANEAALNALLAEWSSGDAYDLRLAHLQGTTPGGANGTTLLSASTVHDDGAVDLLFGGLDQDWFLAHNARGHRDRVIGRRANETITAI